MPQLLTHRYPTFLLQQFLNRLQDGDFSAYLFLGRSQPWEDSANVAVTDSNPPIPVSSTHAETYEFWQQAIGFKKIGVSNAAFVLPRVDWSANTVYSQYDDQSDELWEESFYVLDTTDSPYKVYKCLWNANGTTSTTAPSTIGVSPNPLATLDGYVWQYMYSITSEHFRFLTTSWMPALSDNSVMLNAQTFAGRLPTAVPLTILSGGSSYNAAVSVSATIKGDGSGAAISSNGVVVVGGAVSSITLTSGGANYTRVDEVAITQNGVSNTAVVRAVIPPYPNHGAEPCEELGARHIMVIGTFIDSENGQLSTNNDFRMNGLIIDPIVAATSNIANGAYYSQTYDLTFSSNTGVLQTDDILTNVTKSNTPFGTVVDIIPGANADYIVRMTSVNKGGFVTPFEPLDTLKCFDTGVEITVDAVTPPALKPYTGDIVYVNYRTPVTRSETQVEEIKMVFSL